MFKVITEHYLPEDDSAVLCRGSTHNIYVTYIAVTVSFLEIRRQMIDGRPGDMQIKTLIKSIDEASEFSFTERIHTIQLFSLTVVIM